MLLVWLNKHNQVYFNLRSFFTQPDPLRHNCSQKLGAQSIVIPELTMPSKQAESPSASGLNAYMTEIMAADP